jgi:hypothetical protein
MVLLRSTITTESFVAEDLVKSWHADERIDNHRECVRDVVTNAEASCLETPVKTSDNEQKKRNFVNIHIMN